MPNMKSLLLVTLLSLLAVGCIAADTLYASNGLSAGEKLQSLNGRYVFIMQDDCNLVLYCDGRPIWASGTNGEGINCHCSMQNDGNLVLYSSNGRAIWASNTRGSGANILRMQNDGNAVFYRPVWATKTGMESEEIDPNDPDDEISEGIYFMESEISEGINFMESEISEGINFM